MKLLVFFRLLSVVSMFVNSVVSCGLLGVVLRLELLDLVLVGRDLILEVLVDDLELAGGRIEQAVQHGAELRGHALGHRQVGLGRVRRSS